MSLHNTRQLLTLSHNENILNDEEFLLLYDVNKSKNPDFPYWRYQPFDLDRLNNDECLSNFRFEKSDIEYVGELLRIPDTIRCYNRTRVDGLEAFCIFLQRYAYPIRYGDMVPMFARPVPELCMINHEILNHIYINFNHLLSGFNHH